jgi:SAV_6107-like HEPN
MPVARAQRGVRPLLPPADRHVVALLDRARAYLGQARSAGDPAERFRLAHLAALRCAAAVVADRGRPANARRRLLNLWVVLEAVAPEHREWARYFAAASAARADVEAGLPGGVDARRADEQLRTAAEFLRTVEADVLGPPTRLAG